MKSTKTIYHCDMCDDVHEAFLVTVTFPLKKCGEEVSVSLTNEHYAAYLNTDIHLCATCTKKSYNKMLEEL
jgi:hypothetical protein